MIYYRQNDSHPLRFITFHPRRGWRLDIPHIVTQGTVDNLR